MNHFSWNLILMSTHQEVYYSPGRQSACHKRHFSWILKNKTGMSDILDDSCTSRPHPPFHRYFRYSVLPFHLYFPLLTAISKDATTGQGIYQVNQSWFPISSLQNLTAFMQIPLRPVEVFGENFETVFSSLSISSWSDKNLFLLSFCSFPYFIPYWTEGSFPEIFQKQLFISSQFSFGFTKLMISFS